MIGVNNAFRRETDSSDPPLRACHGLAPDARCGTLAADGYPRPARGQRLFVRRRQEFGG